MGCFYRHLEAFILLGSTRWFSLQPSVETATRYVEEPAHDFNREMESPLLHERVPGSDSLAKYAVAFFKMSRSMRASASSLRNRAFSAASSADVRIPGANG